MKQFGLFILLSLLTIFSVDKMSGANSDDRSRNSLRIMTYNIRSGHGMDEQFNLQNTANVISRVSPDVVALQEIDSVTERTGKIDLLHELADMTLMHHTFAPAIDFQGGKYGIGILSKEKPVRYHYISLPGREEKRALLVVEFEHYIFCCTHLTLTDEDRMASLSIIEQEASTAGKPFFIAGDMNSHPDSPFIQGLKKSFTVLNDIRIPTYPADKPNETIDYIAVRRADSVSVCNISRQVLNEPTASDHRPIVVNVVFAQPENKIFAAKPYLQNPFGNGITVMWQTRVPSYSWVEYGTDKTQLTKARTIVDGEVICNGLQNKIRLTNLVPGKTYYYRVCSKEILLYQAYKKVFGATAVSQWFSFRLPTAADKDFTALVFNDLHGYSKTFHALFDQVKDLHYDFVIYNGDCIPNPLDYNYSTALLNDLTETVDASEKPVFFIRGNHETRDAYSMALPQMFDNPGGKTYGAFTWGDTRFVILDCGEDKPDTTWVYYGLNDFSALRTAQADFLKSELSSSAFKKATKHVLVHHIPLYDKEIEYNPCLELWGGLLAKAPFNISINAHMHRFNFYPKGAQGNAFPVVVGGGPEMESGAVLILQKKDGNLTLRALNTKGETLKSVSL